MTLSLDDAGFPPSPVPVEPTMIPKRRRGPIIAVVVVAIGFAAVAGAWFYDLPYYTIGPGLVRDTSDAIVVTEGERYEPQGGVFFTTVSLRGPVNIFEAIAGWYDPAVDVVPEDRILGGRDPQENRRVNLELMDGSKSVAERLALERLGFAEPAGALIGSVTADSPAEGVLEPGQIVIAVDGVAVTTSNQLVELVSARAPGDVVRLTVRELVPDGEAEPGGPSRDVEVTLAPQPDNPDGGFIGIGVSTHTEMVTPVEVDIDSGSVGGSSAGLAFTLGLVDVLTDGELTGAKRIAVTGTIADGGVVGPIGGVAQKTAAVRREGIDVFVVPRSLGEAELQRAREQAGGEVEIVPVDTLDEALDVLDGLGGNAHELALSHS